MAVIVLTINIYIMLNRLVIIFLAMAKLIKLLKLLDVTQDLHSLKLVIQYHFDK